MNISRSLRFKLILGFAAVMLPLVVFIYVNNIYARQIVREKVSETYRNTLDIFVEQIDRNMTETVTYLYKMAVQDTNTGTIMSYPYQSDEYMLTKVRIVNQITRDLGFYNLVDTIFVITPKDLIFATLSDYNDTRKTIQSRFDEIVDLDRPQEPYKWHLLYDDKVKGGYFLAKAVPVQTGLYVGAFVKITDIAKPLDILWNDGRSGETVISSLEGKALTDGFEAALREIPLAEQPPESGQRYDDAVTVKSGGGSAPALDRSAGGAPGHAEEQRYRTVISKSDGNSYLIMDRSSGVADMTYHIVLPEARMLENLPFFQRATYFIPFGIAVILLFYLLFVRKVMFKPLGELIRGMKKISLGKLDVRLREEQSSELRFMAETFNNMAEQIKNLKIGVYEEQLRLQQAELKQLQAQINPHFYMNSLNVVYNLAVLKDTESVKKMSLHLADYFRFIMRAGRDTITLEEEVRHIANYMDIQNMRFPGKLQFSAEIPEPLGTYPIPALIVQPFGENAIVHGFTNRKRTLELSVIAEEEPPGSEYALVVTVRDNGSGFPPDVLEQLRQGEHLPATAKSDRLGIFNVVHRLKLFYNGAADVQFHEAPGGGAEIRLRLPGGGLAGDAMRSGRQVAGASDMQVRGGVSSRILGDGNMSDGEAG